MKSNRQFDFSEAKRSHVPLLISLIGGSFSGKTYSAYRLASGIARVNKGRIVFIDTEGNRALHYAEDFSAIHAPFLPPYGSLDYMAAIDQAVALKPSVIIVDNFTHEHEGPGGYLDFAETEAESGKNSMQKWSKPQRARSLLRARLQTLPVPLIACFQADEKLDWKPVMNRTAKEPEPMGETLAGSPKFAREMTIRILLRTGSNGVPTWESKLSGEIKSIKLPKQFVPHFSGAPRQITEADGEALARWANGEQMVKLKWSAAASAHLAAMGASLALESLAKVSDALAEDNTLSADETQRLAAALLKRHSQLEGTSK